ncbi:MAG: type IV pilin protein [Thiohalophilus sp.]|jgi:type IV pilus assembly protein PilE
MKKTQHGFTLIELMIVIVIISVLAGIALPAYQSYLTKSRRGDAQGALNNFANVMERYYTENYTYEGAAAGGADTGAPTIFPTQSPLDGSKKYYNLSIQAADATTFTLRATPLAGAQGSDGYLELTSTGRRLWDRNNDGDTDDADEDHW